MKVESGEFIFEWIEDWASLPDSQYTQENGRTHGVAVTRDDLVVVFAQTRPAVLFYDGDGVLQHAWGERFPGAHGLTLVEEEGEEFLWLTDHDTGEVVKTSLEGSVVMNIDPPSLPEKENYKPTSVAVHPQNGDIYVADGYGTNKVRRYDPDGNYLGELTGAEGPEPFGRPHGIAFGPGSQLWITDRSNQRILVYDDGQCLAFRDDLTHSPCNFAFQDEVVFIPELFGSLKIIDQEFNPIGELGANHDVRPPQGWPDQEGWGWPTLKGWPDLAGTSHIQKGRFNSPHDVALSARGDVYVVEWIVGGRILKLERRHRK